MSDTGWATRRGRENETVHSCFIGPLRLELVTEVGWAVAVAVPARGRTKNEDEVNDIHAGYCILPSRAPSAATIFPPPLFFLSLVSPPRAPCLSA